MLERKAMNISRRRILLPAMALVCLTLGSNAVFERNELESPGIRRARLEAGSGLGLDLGQGR